MGIPFIFLVALFALILEHLRMSSEFIFFYVELVGITGVRYQGAENRIHGFA